MKECLLINLFCLLFSFLNSRARCDTIINFLLNKNAIKKRKKGMNFKEWFTFSRFRSEIPYYHIVIYYSVITIYAILFIVILLLNLKSNCNYLIIDLILLISTALWNISYLIILEGFHGKFSEIHHLRGIDKKEYREKMRKLNEQIKKEENSNENAK